MTHRISLLSKRLVAQRPPGPGEGLRVGPRTHTQIVARVWFPGPDDGNLAETVAHTCAIHCGCCCSGLHLCGRVYSVWLPLICGTSRRKIAHRYPGLVAISFFLELLSISKQIHAPRWVIIYWLSNRPISSMVVVHVVIYPVAILSKLVVARKYIQLPCYTLKFRKSNETCTRCG
mgnify:CR=1 FL=1